MDNLESLLRTDKARVSLEGAGGKLRLSGSFEVTSSQEKDFRDARIDSRFLDLQLFGHTFRCIVMNITRTQQHKVETEEKVGSIRITVDIEGREHD
ncbi:MAG TPA: hypothetical protein VGX03_32845 [Candidatus Binatia bacterium]|jgi:hypothetical protein|nr:hypothetical protein [Candidatus Binatia bacterium]